MNRKTKLENPHISYSVLLMQRIWQQEKLHFIFHAGVSALFYITLEEKLVRAKTKTVEFINVWTFAHSNMYGAYITFWPCSKALSLIGGRVTRNLWSQQYLNREEETFLNTGLRNTLMDALSVLWETSWTAGAFLWGETRPPGLLFRSNVKHGTVMTSEWSLM